MSLFGTLFGGGGGGFVAIAPLAIDVATNFTGALPALRAGITGTVTWSKLSGSPLIAIAPSTGVVTLSTALADGVAASALIRVANPANDADERTLTITGRAAAATPAPVNTVAPAFAGGPQAGVATVSTTGTWTNAASYTYNFRLDGTSAQNGASNSFTPAAPDAGKVLTYTVTATGPGGSTASGTITAGAVAAAGAATLPAPVFDGFGGGPGLINARATETGGAVWGMVTLSGTVNLSGLQILAGFPNAVSGQQGTNNSNHYGVIAVADTPRKIVRRRIDKGAAIVGATLASQLYQASLFSTAGSTASYISPVFSATGAAGNFRIYSVDAGAAGPTNFLVASNAYLANGDSLEEHYDTVGSDRVVTYRQNGRQLGPQINLTTFFPALPIVHAFGYRAQLPNNGPITGMTIVDPDTQGYISLRSSARVIQIEANGSVVARIDLGFTVSAPASANVEIRAFDSAGAAIYGWSALTGYTVAGLTAAALAPVIVTPPLAGFYFECRRTDITGGVYPTCRGPLQFAGNVEATTGQSLNMQADHTGISSTAAPANNWRIDGTIDYAGGAALPNPYDRRQFPLLSNTALALYAATYDAYVVAAGGTVRPRAFVTCGRGGTPTVSRIPGTANHDAQRDGVQHGGRHVARLAIHSGQYDTGAADNAYAGAVDTDRTNFAANTDLIVADTEALTGATIRCPIEPLSAIWDFSDTASENLRWRQWKMTQDNPGRYVLGAYCMDLQHATGDSYHLSTSAYGQRKRRDAIIDARMDGLTTRDANGPKLVSVAVTSSSTIDVTFDLNGYATLAYLNASTDYRGGLRIGAAAAGSATPFTTPLVPTAQSITGAVLTLTFAATPFAGLKAFVSGPYGTEPFNPTKSTTIRNTGNMALQSTQLVGTFAGEPSIPIQPYYQASGVNWIESP